MGRVERLALYVALTALTAFAIDGVLPTMPLIEGTFKAETSLTNAQIMTAFALGMALGELVIGPISDALGRRPAVIMGLAIFVLGTVIAATAASLATVILGRFLQGVGVAGPKIGTRAMIRDQYVGADMARILSVIFTLLVLVPMIAPAIGALIASLAGWRGVFWAYLVLAAVLAAWLWGRHPETLKVGKRVPLDARALWQNTRAMLGRNDVTPIVIATGFVFGAQLVYFTVAADIFGVIYGAQSFMPALFALLATGIGLALLLNVWLVGRTGMKPPIFASLLIMGVSGAGLLISALIWDARPPLALLLGLTWSGFFGLGLLFGNLNAVAMRPLGDLAGLGATIIASGSSFVAFVYATLLGLLVHDPVWALAWSFSISALLAACCILIAGPTKARTVLRRPAGR